MDSLRSREIYRDNRVSLIVVESVTLQRKDTEIGNYILGSLKPIAVVIQASNSRYALDMNANPMSLESLSVHLPELDTTTR